MCYAGGQQLSVITCVKVSVCSVSKCSVKEKTVSMSCKVTDETEAEQQQSITEATMLHLLKTQVELLPTC